MSNNENQKPLTREELERALDLAQQRVSGWDFMSRPMDPEPDDVRVARALIDQAGIVALLPKTADGVPVVTGMTLYSNGHSEEAIKDQRIYTIKAIEPGLLIVDDIEDMSPDERWWDLCECTYSTREAAELAARTAVQEGEK